MSDRKSPGRSPSRKNSAGSPGSRKNSGRELQLEPVGSRALQPYNNNARSVSLGASDLDNTIMEVAAAAEEQNGHQRRIVRVQSGVSRKVEFKKTKKLHKKASALYKKSMAEVTGGKFTDWSRAELISLIVSVHRFELRNEDRLETVALRDLCVSFYVGKPAPEKPPPPTFQQIVFENVMARRIQNCWIVYMAGKRIREEEDQQRQYQYQAQDIGASATEEIGQAELMYMTMRNEMVVGGAVQSIEGNESIDLTDHSSTSGKGSRKKKGVNVLDIPWTAPDLTKAKRYADYVQPRKDAKEGVKFKFNTTTTGRHCCLGGLGEQFDLWQEGQVSEFSIYGPGVTNYFKFMKWCFWLFVALTIIALPALVLNTSGGYENNAGLKSIARTTIGNLAITTANSTIHVPIPGCDNYGIYTVSCTFNADSLSLFYAIIDIFVSLTIFIAFVWLTIFERLEENTLDESTIRASMYTIAVSNLPPDVTEDELYDHFGGLVKSKRSVVAISLAYDNVDEIKQGKLRGDFIRSKVRLVHEHRFKCTEIKKNFTNEEEAARLTNDERNKFFEKMRKLNADLKVVEDDLVKLAEKPMNVVYAYITFDKCSDRNKILDLYRNMSAFTYFCRNKHLKVRNRLIHVSPAPEPSVIIWENLSFTMWDRTKRKILTTFAALLLIVITLIMVFSSKYLEQTATNNGNDSSDYCPENFDDWTEDEQQQYVDDNPSELYCYCGQFSTFQQATNSYCRDFLRKNIQSQVLLYFASMIVLLVNILIDKAIHVSSSFEKHHTSDGKGMSVFMRIFILKYINTAAVFLINNNNVILQRVFNVDAASTMEFSADWYNQIGTTIILVQLGDVLNAHAGHFWKFLRFWRTKSLATAHPERFLTQEELNKALGGPKFEFAGNYAQILSTFFVCLTFSTGIPILYPIAAVNFILFYWVEKYQFVHVYKIPPHFNTLVGRRATAFVPLAILIHLVMSIWVLSNNSLFNTNKDDNSSVVDTTVFGETIADKITAKATFPLFITACVLIFLRLLMSFLRAFWNSLVRMYMLFFSFLTPKRAAAYAKKQPKKKSAARDVVAYTRAVQRNLIKGLSNYNILLNPQYKEAFGITWKFAAENKNVRDVKNIKAKAHTGADEDDAAKADELTRKAALQGRAARSPANKNTASTASTPTTPSNGATQGSTKKPAMANRRLLGSFYGDLNAANNLERPSSVRSMTPTADDVVPVAAANRDSSRSTGSAGDVPVTPAPTPARDSGRNSGRVDLGLRIEIAPNTSSTSGSSRTPTPVGSSRNQGPSQPTPAVATAMASTPTNASVATASGSNRVASATPVVATAYAYPDNQQQQQQQQQRPAAPVNGQRPGGPSPALTPTSRGNVSPAGAQRNAAPQPGYPGQPRAGVSPTNQYPPQGYLPQGYPQQGGYGGPMPRGNPTSPVGMPHPQSMNQQQAMQYQQMQYIQQQQAAYYAAQQNRTGRQGPSNGMPGGQPQYGQSPRGHSMSPSGSHPHYPQNYQHPPPRGGGRGY